MKNIKEFIESDKSAKEITSKLQEFFQHEVESVEYTANEIKRRIDNLRGDFRINLSDREWPEGYYDMYIAANVSYGAPSLNLRISTQGAVYAGTFLGHDRPPINAYKNARISYTTGTAGITKYEIEYHPISERDLSTLIRWLDGDVSAEGKRQRDFYKGRQPD